jgi:acetoin utilization protein AcuB
MLVEDIMTRDVITVEPTDTIRSALLKVQQCRIRHIPVVENGKLVGIISDRDVRDACPSILSEPHEDDEDIFQAPVSCIMRKDVITASPLDFVEEAAYVLYENGIGCLPVVSGEENKLVGIITKTDILYTLVELMGVNFPSSRIEVEVDDRIGTLTDVTQLFKLAKCNVSSVLVFPGKKPAKKNLVFRIQTIDPRKIVSMIKGAGYHVVWPKDPGEYHE